MPGGTLSTCGLRHHDKTNDPRENQREEAADRHVMKTPAGAQSEHQVGQETGAQAEAQHK
jgi:hypothetical protein